MKHFGTLNQDLDWIQFCFWNNKQLNTIKTLPICVGKKRTICFSFLNTLLMIALLMKNLTEIPKGNIDLLMTLAHLAFIKHLQVKLLCEFETKTL